MPTHMSLCVCARMSTRMPARVSADMSVHRYDEVVPLDELRAEEAELKSEVGLLSRLRHGNILTLYAATALPP